MQVNRYGVRSWCAAATAVITAAWLFDAWRMPAASEGLLFDDVQQLPTNRVGLVLGCMPRLQNGRDNAYFVRRIEAAARLYHAGKVEYLLVSGDADRDGQNEPRAMREALLARQVPGERIVADEFGLRTLDSLARAKLVYGLAQLTLVSQRFHNERAAYIARALGLSVVGYNADDPRLPYHEMRFREPVARLVAVLDRRVFKTQPRHLGERVTIGERR